MLWAAPDGRNCLLCIQGEIRQVCNGKEVMQPQTRLLNSKTKEPVKDAEEIKSIQKWLEELASKPAIEPAAQCSSWDL